jgi:hypothetical protein
VFLDGCALFQYKTHSHVNNIDVVNTTFSANEERERGGGREGGREREREQYDYKIHGEITPLKNACSCCFNNKSQSDTINR